ncbi:MAG: metallophosphoesterase family protein [Deltaproteobacteria bacterium]|nr:metallophosphoesterase family protein [Deltaproteobacteria bacterium]MBW1748138.1 metallophosphoesterase family protein [Deltaproteobacteria bacterium]MBW1825503.1 metallophosphoesterase family protein [Deltaproteobacteria bacterium]MBW1969118.1 metallophosphoesterase family protein [Deltaproteobacteria bacterium]MBW2157023.1 metallophosphoesterase family protein [Deltaproteobacteria bacterium]
MPVNFENKGNVVVGVISDTHGLLPTTAAKALKGVDLIIHAGDVGSSDVLKELQTIAPVVAVRGNMDRVKSLKKLPLTETVEIADVLLYVIHDIHRLDIAPSESGFDAVIHGHLHCPSVAENSGVLFLNPGSAAQPRRNFPASLALLHIRGNSIKTQIVDI